MLGRVLRPPLHVRPNRRRRGVEDRDAVALDDVPPAVLVGEVGRPLVEDGRGAVRQRAVDDVAVAGDPADVGRTPVDVLLGPQVEDQRVRRRDADEIAPRRVRDPFRLRRRAGRVHQEEQVLGVHRLRRAGGRVVGDVEVVQPVVAPFLHRHVVAGAADDEALPDPGRVRHRRVRGLLQRDRAAAPPGLVLSDQDLAAHVVRAVGERVGGEAAEDDGVRRAEARARQHRDRELREPCPCRSRPSSPCRRRAP